MKQMEVIRDEFGREYFQWVLEMTIAPSVFWMSSILRVKMVSLKTKVDEATAGQSGSRRHGNTAVSSSEC